MSSGSVANGASLFKDEEIRHILYLEKCEDYIQVSCGCTNKKYGDFVGSLKVDGSGDLEIICKCYEGCSGGLPMTAAEFEKHAGRKPQSRWAHNIWVHNDKGKKVKLAKTALLKYYEEQKRVSGPYRGRRKRDFHRDEFICCADCKKMRRFHLQTKEEIRMHHDALKIVNWKCSDFPLGNLSCNIEEERATRQAVRSCPRAVSCKGCTKCVCFGCDLCCFPDCNCQTCVDYRRMNDL